MKLRSFIVTGATVILRQNLLWQVATESLPPDSLLTLSPTDLLALAKKPLPQVLSPDVVILRPTDATIGVSEIRAFTSRLPILPTHQKFRFGLILEANTLTIGAQNALLKTLEEPPPKTAILLSAADDTSFLPTIRSRAVTISLPPETSYSPTSKEAADLFSKLSTLSLGQKFALAASNSSKEKALEFVNNLLLSSHQKLAINGSLTPEALSLARSCFKANRYLSGNANPRAVLENLLCFW